MRCLQLLLIFFLDVFRTIILSYLECENILSDEFASSPTSLTQHKFIMVVRIRLAMHGPRNNKFFHIVAMNAKRARDAKPIETLGIYKPSADLPDGHKTKTVEWSVQRIKYWLGVGALPSKSAVKLFTQGRILPPDSKFHLKSRMSSVNA